MFSDPALKRAKSAIAKAGLFNSRPKLFIRLKTVELMLAWALENPAYIRFAMLWVVTYAFLLRLPSEALPITAGASAGQSSLLRRDGKLFLKLRRRKNKPGGSTLERACWCKESSVLIDGYLLHCFVLHLRVGQGYVPSTCPWSLARCGI